MTHLDTILGTLLLRNNCVIIPSLGGFVANYVSANVDIKNGLITPPKKALSFNKNLNTNDGLVIHHLAYEKNISFDEAKEIVTIEVQKIKAELNKGMRIHFHNVGFLYINSAGKVAFEQERFFNLLLSSYGLGNVQFITENESSAVSSVRTTRETPKVFQPTQKEEQVEAPIKREETKSPQKIEALSVVKEPIVEVKVEEVVVEQKLVIPVQKITAEEPKEIEHPAVTAARSSKGLISKIIKYSAVAALVPVLFYSFWIPMKTDVLQSGVLYHEDFNPFYKTASFEYAPDLNKTHLWIDSVKSSETLSSIINNLSSSTPVFTYPIDDDLYIPVQRKNKTKKVDLPSKATPTTKNSFHAIVGCFGDSSNANKVISRLKAQGFNAYEVDVKGGLHRISAGDAKTRAEMEVFQQSLSNKNIDSWVLKN